MAEPPPVMAVSNWKTNADLIADVARLGYLDGTVLDTTYGEAGGFWKVWRPEGLVAADVDPNIEDLDLVADFTCLPFADESFDSVVMDPPYRLNGTPTLGEFDSRYGIGAYTRWQDRMDLILRGVTECCRVSRSFVLTKTQDQICSGKVVWQSDLVTDTAAKSGFTKVDRFDFVTAMRPQPPGRRQVHARRNASQLLVFRKEK